MLLRKKEEIENWLNKYNINNYELIKDKKYGYIVNVNGYVNLYEKKLNHIKVKFNKIGGNFICGNNELESLEGCPEIIGGYFDCSNNQLTSLEGCPKIIGDNFYCSQNLLKTLKGGPEIVEGGFFCFANQLTSLEGCPEIINGDFICSKNQLKSLKGSTEITKGNYYFNENQLKSLKGCPEIINGSLDCSDNNLNIESLKDLPKYIKDNYIKILNNKKLGNLQNIKNFEELKKQVDIYFEKNKLLNLVNEKKFNKNKYLNKI